MTPPIDDLRQGDSGGERDTDDEERVRSTSATAPLAELRRRGRHRLGSRLLVRRGFALRTRHHKARLELPEKGCILCERLGETGAQAAAAGGLIREALQTRRSLLDECVALSHFFAGGASPVAMRQIRDASRRAPIVATAPIPAYRPVHSSLRSTVFS
jgi:hypothetical protein